MDARTYLANIIYKTLIIIDMNMSIVAISKRECIIYISYYRHEHILYINK